MYRCEARDDYVPRCSVSAAVAGGDPSDDESADGAGGEDGRECFGDDGVGKAEQNSEEQTGEPSGPGQFNVADYEAECEAGDECAEHGGALVGKRERNHHGGIDAAENQSAKNAERDSGHGLPPEGVLAKRAGRTLEIYFDEGKTGKLKRFKRRIIPGARLGNRAPEQNR